MRTTKCEIEANFNFSIEKVLCYVMRSGVQVHVILICFSFSLENEKKVLIFKQKLDLFLLFKHKCELFSHFWLKMRKKVLIFKQK